MAKLHLAKAPCIATEPMEESLEFIFFTMLKQGEVSEAVDFITSIDCDFRPSKTAIRALIFKVLMKSDDVRCLSKVSVYLTNVINACEPINNERRRFFLDAVREDHGFLSDLWSVFCHIVNSCFCHHEIYVVSQEDSRATPLKYPNCKFLFDLYVNLFTVDFRYFFVDSFKSCLVMRLFWPSGDSSASNRTECLYKWINDVYGIPSVNQPPKLLQNLHVILTMVARSLTEGKFLLKEETALNHPSLANVAEDLTNFCKNAFSSLSNVKLFLSFITLPCLQVRVSEKIIRLIFKQSTKSFSILTLKEIVNQYMFPQKFNKWKTPKPAVCIEKNLRKRGEKSSDSNKKMERTVLHDLCEQNKFGDLVGALKRSSDDINTRDHSGYTPLNRACLSGSYMCVKILIDEAGKAPAPKLDFTTANSEGQTPLHIAVKANHLQIAELLLISGGSDLLNSLDNKSKLPCDLSPSIEMKRLLEEYKYKSAPVTATNEIDTFIEDSQMKEAPSLKSFKEYSIYLHSLSCLLCTYTDVTQLYNFVWKKTDLVQSHSTKHCFHYDFEETACLEDTTLLSEMPDLIDVFIQSIQKNVSKLNINVDIELLPLKGYKASIQPKT